MNTTYLFLFLGLALLGFLSLWFRYHKSSLTQETLKREIKELQKNQIVLSQERDQLTAVLRGMREGLVVTDPQGVITMSNPSFYREFHLEKRCEGKSLLETLMNPEVHDILRKAIKEKRTQEEEILFRLGRPENEASSKTQEKYSLVYCSPLLEADKVTGSILVFFDVTQIRHLERIRRDFVANVSHELKTPLTSIRGFAETLLEGAVNNPETAKRFLSKIEKNASNLQNLIEDLLRLSEIESGRLQLHPIPLTLANIFQEIKTNFTEILGEKDIQLKIDAPTDSKVLAESAALKQILTNLIENAIKYSNPGGDITLAAEPKENRIEISIADTGIGIPAKDLPHIFERFYRVDKARSRDLGGTGLGLAIVKHLVHTHGGNVQVESTEGKGTCFHFALPAA